MIYLDHNATSPLCEEAREAMAPWWGRPANPMSRHGLGREAAMAVDRARETVARATGWFRDGVVFTSGATEGNNLVLSQGHWAASAVEHPSVLARAARRLPVDSRGVVVLDEDEQLDDVDGVSVQLANNETGIVQPVPEVVAWARARGRLVHVDAAQAPGRLSLDACRDADFVTLSSHKCGGPQGVGAVLVARGRVLAPLSLGGPQERGQRAGSHFVAGIVGFAAALARPPGDHDARRERLEAGLSALGGRVLGAPAPRLPQTTCVVFDGVDAADLVVALDLAGVAVSAGAACASGSTRRSHVLAAMGEVGTGTRFSLGRDTTVEDIDRALAAVSAAVPRLRVIESPV